MAPILTTNTARMVVDYIWRGRPYSTLYRFDNTVLSPTGAASLLHAFHTFVSQYFYTNWSVGGTGAWYAQGVNFSVPVAFPEVIGSGATDPNVQPDAAQIQVLGRTLGGRRGSWYHQGFDIAFNNDLRASGVENTNVSAYISAFETLIDDGLCAIDGQPPTLKGYVNLVVNDYLTRQARAG